MIASFPNLALSVEDIYWMGNEQDGYLVSVRWGAIGSHKGNGSFGHPTGIECYIAAFPISYSSYLDWAPKGVLIIKSIWLRAANVQNLFLFVTLILFEYWGSIVITEKLFLFTIGLTRLDFGK